MMCMEVPWCATCQIYADGDVDRFMDVKHHLQNTNQSKRRRKRW